MQDHVSILTGAATVSVLFATLLATPASAGFVTVSRCNAGGDNGAPVLHFVNDGDRFTVAIGENSLTRDIIFNERAALDWAAASGLFPDGTIFGDYANRICGLLREETVEQVEFEPEPEEPETPEEPDQPKPPDL